MTIDKIINIGKIAVKEAANKLLSIESLPKKIESIELNGKEIKLQADLLLNEILIKRLKKTNIPILSEETEADISTKGLQWIIDPLDGSVNYLRGIPYYSISVALCEDMNPVYGILYDFTTNRLIGGGKQGLSSENMNFSCSNVNSINRAILTTGLPVRMANNHDTLMQFISYFQYFHKIRMFGSASQSLLHIAAGKVDAYYEKDIMIWDVAAGLALVEAAGGKWRWQEGSKRNSKIVYASTSGIFDEFTKIMKK